MNEREMAQSLIANYPPSIVTTVAKLFLQADTENKRLREALKPASELADAVGTYGWIDMLYDDKTRHQLYDAMRAWKKIRQALEGSE